MVVIILDLAPTHLIQDSPVKYVLNRLQAFNELVWLLLTLRDHFLRDFVVSDQVAHEVLDYVALTLFQACFLHKFQDPQIVDNVFNVLLVI